MNSEHFDHLKSLGYNYIPLFREVLADLDTPLSVYLKLSNRPYSFLFESVQGGEKWGRYSIIGLPSQYVIRIKDRTISVFIGGRLQEQLHAADPLQWIDAFQANFKVPKVKSLPVFTGGLVGYFGYDTVRYIEPKLGESNHPDPLGNDDILLMLAKDVVVFDNLCGKLFVVTHVDPDSDNAYVDGQAQLQSLVDKLSLPTPSLPNCPSSQLDEADFVSNYGEENFKRDVETCRQHIIAGDCMQVVLSQRLSIDFFAHPLNLYRALRMINPSPYLFYLDLDDCAIVGSSPEILVRLEDGEVTVRPIAGTRPRGDTEQHDRELEENLLADPKELAEHLMLIDLGRNDVGRIAETGSVILTDRMMIERYSHVMHIVSNVKGQLKSDLSAMDVLRATFPAGTVSGAPKVRAMEIIDTLEPIKRGIYSGAVGYLGWQGNMDTAIAIRTAVIKDNTLHIQAGAGVVYDSVPQNEWNEAMNKARAFFRAAAIAEKGLFSNVRSSPTNRHKKESSCN